VPPRCIGSELGGGLVQRRIPVGQQLRLARTSCEPNQQSDDRNAKEPHRAGAALTTTIAEWESHIPRYRTCESENFRENSSFLRHVKAVP
jgi:hypothetical protein